MTTVDAAPGGPSWSEVFVTGPFGSAYTRNRPMTLITKAQTEKLLANGIAQRAAIDQDAKRSTSSPSSSSSLFFVWPGHSHIPVLVRHRRVRGVTLTRLSASGRCHIHVASRRPMHLAPHRNRRKHRPRLRPLRSRNGRAELGYVSIFELRTVRGKLGLPIERDLHFEADKPISAYADEARTRGHIIT